MKIKLLVFISLLGLYPFTLPAITVAGLYETTVPVVDESAANKTEALQQAMQQVLIKLSGNKNIANVAGASEIMSQAQQYVQQFRYNQPVTTTPEEEPMSSLLVKFDETALNKAMRDYALSLWGKERPAVLVWLALDDAYGRRMVSFEENPKLLDALNKTASSRGIPLLFPLLDLQDTSSLNISDVWGNFRQPIMAASARYQSDAVLVGRITKTAAGLWTTQWSLYMGQQAMDWSTEGDRADMVMEEAIDELADTLAQRYANVGSTGVELIEVQVSNVNTLDDYARALSYLESLPSVTEVRVKMVVTGQVSFELTSHGGVAAIDQTVQLGRVLQATGIGQQHSYRLLEGY